MKSLYRLKNIKFNYEKDFSFNISNLEINKSKITGFIGPNGSGKTTLLNLLSFLNLPHSGGIFFDDIELSKNNIKEFRKTVGYVQQNPYLFRSTVFHNIEIGLKINHVDRKKRKQKVNEILSLLRIEHLSNRFAPSLSSGEARKVAIGQVMVLEPTVLVMDEPFSNLDENSVLDLEELIVFLKEKLDKTIIFTTHDQIQAQKLTSCIHSLVKGRLFSTHLINLFRGKFDESKNVFNTGKQEIITLETIDNAEYVAIDPRQIVLSLEKLDSSMQNSFYGKITGMTESNNSVHLNVDIGEKIQTVITRKAFNELKLSLNMSVWVSFKSTSVMIF